MDSNQPSGQTQIVQNRDPWSGQQPFLTKGFEQADIFRQQPQQFYPNSTVVPFSGQTEQALEMTENRALAGSPLRQAAGGMFQDTVGGDYLNAGNPYLENAFNAAVRPITQQYENVVMPGINSTFSAGGRYGSNAHQKSLGMANEGLARSLSDMGGAMAFKNYEGERTNQLRAGMMAPEFAAGDYQDIGQLANVGATREAQAKNVLQEDINRFMFAQQSPRNALAEYMAMVAGGQYGGQTTTQQPLYSNPFVQGLGTLGTGVGIMGHLFGGSNPLFNKPW